MYKYGVAFSFQQSHKTTQNRIATALRTPQRRRDNPVSHKACLPAYFTTLIFTLAFLPLAVLTVMVAVPFRLAVTTPALFTAATDFQEEL